MASFGDVADDLLDYRPKCKSKYSRNEISVLLKAEGEEQFSFNENSEFMDFA